MAEYYYFVSSLPSIYADKESLITYENFIKEASKQLSKKDFSEVKEAIFKAKNDKKVKSKVLSAWLEFESQLNDLLSLERAKNLGYNTEDYKISFTPDRILSEKIKRIVENPNPLSAENELLKLYFSFLDSHEVSSPFSTEALVLYALKLQIKERAVSFSEEKGRIEFDNLYKEIENEIFSLK